MFVRDIFEFFVVRISRTLCGCNQVKITAANVCVVEGRCASHDDLRVYAVAVLVVVISTNVLDIYPDLELCLENGAAAFLSIFLFVFFRMFYSLICFNSGYIHVKPRAQVIHNSMLLHIIIPWKNRLCMVCTCMY